MVSRGNLPLAPSQKQTYYRLMKDLSVSDFKTHLAAYLRAVKKGERFVITEHKKPVAEVTPVNGNKTWYEPAARPFTVEPEFSVEKPGLWRTLLDEERAGR